MIQSNDVLPHSFKADDANWPKQMFSHNVRNVLIVLEKTKIRVYIKVLIGSYVNLELLINKS